MDIEALKKEINSEIEKIGSRPELEELRIKYLGRKGLVNQLTATLPGMSTAERAKLGQEINAFKNQLNSLLKEKEAALVNGATSQNASRQDIGLPGIAQSLGRLHPITQTIDEICGIFTQMGFAIVEGPEVETEFNNFTGLNIALEHPSRDVFDTFYLKLSGYPVSRLSGSTGKQDNGQTGKLLLRSHTSPVQVRVMKKQKPPLAVVVPGRVYRPDAVDASHSFMFHQIEGFMVDEGIRFSDLKGMLEVFSKGVFGEKISMRFRPHYFPFTEPSVEVDISCIICQGKGCSVCGRKGWLEILGAGMIHPNVFKNVGYPKDKYTGFAFGMGVERICMLKYGIDDIRLFFENDLRFLRQF